MVAWENLHRMDVETAYLHAPIDYELYTEQPEGYEIRLEAADVNNISHSMI